MRPIKFRAWHTTQKKMLSGFYLDSNGQIGVWNNEETEIDFGPYPYLELMQFTGLHDKNGTEIYEGDVCRTDAGIAAVKWSDRGGSFLWAMNQGTYIIDAFRDMAEVLGNIHENTALLKDSGAGK